MTATAQPSAQPGLQPTVVLVHGAFADASSWNGVIERLQQQGCFQIGEIIAEVQRVPLGDLSQSSRAGISSYQGKSRGAGPGTSASDCRSSFWPGWPIFFVTQPHSFL